MTDFIFIIVHVQEENLCYCVLCLLSPRILASGEGYDRGLIWITKNIGILGILLMQFVMLSTYWWLGHAFLKYNLRVTILVTCLCWVRIDGMKGRWLLKTRNKQKRNKPQVTKSPFLPFIAYTITELLYPSLYLSGAHTVLACGIQRWGRTGCLLWTFVNLMMEMWYIHVNKYNRVWQDLTDIWAAVEALSRQCLVL